MKTPRKWMGAGLLLSALALGGAADAGNPGRSYFDEPVYAEGPVMEGQFGESLATADFDRDGFPDMAIGAPTNGSGDGSVSIFSGRDGSLVQRLLGPQCRGAQFGRELATGDLDRDGIPDLVVGAPHQGNYKLTNTGGFYIYSGRTGLPVRHTVGWDEYMQLGTSLGIADLNDDGRLDLIVGASNYQHGGTRGAFFVYSGKTGNQIREIHGVGGRAIGDKLVLGDVNQDGVQDLVVSAQHVQGGEVQVFSGKDGELLHRFRGETLEFGRGLACADVNRDGYADILVGDIYATGTDRLKNAGAVFIYSGSDGSLLREWRSKEANSMFGHTIAATDLDRDGAVDVFVSSPLVNNAAGRITGFSSRSGQELTRLDYVPETSSPLGGLGATMSFFDVNNDGRTDLLAGAPFRADGLGAAFLYFGTYPASVPR